MIVRPHLLTGRSEFLGRHGLDEPGRVLGPVVLLPVRGMGCEGRYRIKVTGSISDAVADAVEAITDGIADARKYPRMGDDMARLSSWRWRRRGEGDHRLALSVSWSDLNAVATADAKGPGHSQRATG